MQKDSSIAACRVQWTRLLFLGAQLTSARNSVEVCPRFPDCLLAKATCAIAIDTVDSAVRDCVGPREHTCGFGVMCNIGA